MVIGFKPKIIEKCLILKRYAKSSCLGMICGKCHVGWINPYRLSPLFQKVMRMMKPKKMFDAYIFVDWSANSSPKSGTDSIWIAEANWSDKGGLNWPLGDRGCYNATTRDDAILFLKRRLHLHTQQNCRVLIGFDFAYGYPYCDEFCRIAVSTHDFVIRLNEDLQDDSKNRNNRFLIANQLNGMVDDQSGEGPFWGCPSQGQNANYPYLPRKKPANWHDRNGNTLKEYRVVESRLRNAGRRPFSVWQLFGNGSVGSQTLLGLPKVFELRNDSDLAACSTIWPFETGWCQSFDEKSRIVHAEFWPGLIDVDLNSHPVRDAAQVKSFVTWASSQDFKGQLGAYFDPLSADDPDRELALREGWILGFRIADQ